MEEMVTSENEVGGGPDPLCGLHRAAWAVDPRIGARMAGFSGSVPFGLEG